jgi:hypothetical protein
VKQQEVDEQTAVLQMQESEMAELKDRAAKIERRLARKRKKVEMKEQEALEVQSRTEQQQKTATELQAQLRSLKADRERQRQYRAAVIQQYRFLSDFLRSLADQLPRRGDRITAHFRIEVSARSVSAEESNGDRCMAFSGPGCKYYVLLCDGMGTGLGAVNEGSSAARMLKTMLCAGFPAEHALESVNSLCALRGQAGAVTMDLAEILLDSGSTITRLPQSAWPAGAAHTTDLSVSDVNDAAAISATVGKPGVVQLAPGVQLEGVTPVFCGEEEKGILGMDILSRVRLIHVPSTSQASGCFFIAL